MRNAGVVLRCAEEQRGMARRRCRPRSGDGAREREGAVSEALRLQATTLRRCRSRQLERVLQALRGDPRVIAQPKGDVGPHVILQSVRRVHRSIKRGCFGAKCSSLAHI